MPLDTAALLRKAITSENNGDLAGAMAGYEKIIRHQPGNIDALFLLGRGHCQQGQLETGAEVFRKIVRLRPDHAPAQTLLGMVLFRLGNPQESLACLEHALAADPRSELALVTKADALGALGRHSEALVEYDKALSVNAGNVVAWCNRGTVLEALGRDIEAVQSFERANALNPNLAQVHFNLANALLRLERNEEAAHHYQHALALEPNLAAAYAGLGRALVLLERWQEAIDSFEQALKLEPGSLQLYTNMGLAFWHLQRFPESLASYDKALTIEPSNAAALNRKGWVLCVLGRLDEGQGLIEKAIELAPGEAEYYLNLSEMKRFAPGDRQLTAMEQLLPNIESRPVQDQTNLYFALGKVYGDIRDFDRSFDCLLKANALRRGQLSYNEPVVIERFNRVCRIFTPELLRNKAGHGNPSTQPIFIVGMPRSGTTLIEQIMASHPRVYGAGERKDLQTALFSVIDESSYPEAVARMTPAQFDEISAAYIASMAGSLSDSVRFTNKMPANFIHVGLIRLALPNARIIHVRRNPVDTCLSCFSINFSEWQNFAYELGELGRYYRAYEMLMEHWRQVLPEDAMLEVHYEDVVNDLEAQARRITAYCGLEWDDACLQFHRTARPVTTASVAQVRQPIYRNSVERWRAYEDHLKPLLEALGQPV